MLLLREASKVVTPSRCRDLLVGVRRLDSSGSRLSCCLDCKSVRKYEWVLDGVVYEGPPCRSSRYLYLLVMI